MALKSGVDVNTGYDIVSPSTSMTQLTLLDIPVYLIRHCPGLITVLDMSLLWICHCSGYVTV